MRARRKEGIMVPGQCGVGESGVIVQHAPFWPQPSLGRLAHLSFFCSLYSYPETPEEHLIATLALLFSL